MPGRRTRQQRLRDNYEKNIWNKEHADRIKENERIRMQRLAEINRTWEDVCPMCGNVCMLNVFRGGLCEDCFYKSESRKLVQYVDGRLQVYADRKRKRDIATGAI